MKHVPVLAILMVGLWMGGASAMDPSVFEDVTEDDIDKNEQKWQIFPEIEGLINIPDFLSREDAHLYNAQKKESPKRRPRRKHRPLLTMRRCCGKLFENKIELERHQESHNKTLFCAHCPLKFGTNALLKFHQLHRHGICAYTCDVQGCLKQFKKKKELTRHQQKCIE